MLVRYLVEPEDILQARLIPVSLASAIHLSRNLLAQTLYQYCGQFSDVNDHERKVSACETTLDVREPELSFISHVGSQNIGGFSIWDGGQARQTQFGRRL